MCGPLQLKAAVLCFPHDTIFYRAARAVRPIYPVEVGFPGRFPGYAYAAVRYLFQCNAHFCAPSA